MKKTIKTKIKNLYITNGLLTYAVIRNPKVIPRKNERIRFCKNVFIVRSVLYDYDDGCVTIDVKELNNPKYIIK